MDHDDVAPSEMRWNRPDRDEIDAVTSGVLFDDDDLVDVALIVHDLRSAYRSDVPLARSPELAAFGAGRLDDKGEPLVTAGSNAQGSASQTSGLPKRDGTRKERHHMLKTLTALTAGLAGKIALGTAVAAAAGAGGLHAAGVVDVPGLPGDDGAPPALVVSGEAPGRTDDTAPETTDAAAPETTDAAAPATTDAESVAAAAEADEPVDAAESEEPSEFSLQMQAWSECVDAASEARDAATATIDASVDGPPGRFDPEEACGPRPINPAAAAEHGKPDDTPGGPPEGRPVGPPASTPVGPPEGVPVGPPESTPVGPPESTPVGPRVSTPVGPPVSSPGHGRPSDAGTDD